MATKIFFSWQSDLDQDITTKSIRKSIDKFIKYSSDFQLDEATRNTSGSPNIPPTIFNKISKCDIFICDVTTINGDNNDNRKMPNPNVLIELGYAIATIGWSRIIMLYNTEIYKLELPFDISTNRVSTFKIKDSNDNKGKEFLMKLIQNAIQAIVDDNPLKPYYQTPEFIKRKNDIDCLNTYLKNISFRIFDDFFQNMPRLLNSCMFQIIPELESIIKSTSFSIYDKELKNKIEIFTYELMNALNYGNYYIDYNNHFKFVENEDNKLIFSEISNLRDNLKWLFDDLFMIIRENYLEIDLNETNKIANIKLQLI